MLVLCLGNFTASTVLTYLGVTDYYYMVNVSHAILLLAFLAIVFLFGRAMKRRAFVARYASAAKRPTS